MSYNFYKSNVSEDEIASQIPNQTYLVGASNGAKGASDTYGRIARAQWNDYKARFMPVEDTLIDSIGNPFLLEKQIDRNVGSVNLSFDNARAGSDRAMRQYGAQLNRKQQNASTRSSNLSQNLATIDAKNVTRLAKKERDMQSIAGSASTSGTARKDNMNV